MTLPEPPELDEPGLGPGIGRSIYERWADDFRIWSIEEAIRTDDDQLGPWAVILVGGPHRMCVNETDLLRRLRAGDSRWHDKNPYFVGGRGLDGDFQRQYRPIERRIAPRTASELEVEQLAGRGSRIRANAFLEGEDGLVDPSKGPVQGWKACLSARGPTDDLIAVCVLGRPRARSLDDGDVLEVYRLAAHPIRPQNTNSHLLGHARSWASEHGYDRLVSYANLDEQSGTSYEAAGFELTDTTTADPVGWKDHGDDRQATGDEPWTRGRYEIAL